MAKKKLTIRTANRLLKAYAGLFIKELGLEQFSINWILISKDCKEGVSAALDITSDSEEDDLYAQTVYTPRKKRPPKTYYIVVYYDKCKKEKDFIGTMFHELLHVKFRKLDKLVSNYRSKEYDEIEEDIISRIEKIFLSAI